MPSRAVAMAGTRQPETAAFVQAFGRQEQTHKHNTPRTDFCISYDLLRVLECEWGSGLYSLVCPHRLEAATYTGATGMIMSLFISIGDDY